jgi:hypothetical protein
MRRVNTVLGLAILMAGVCHGQTKCPWINEATASAILDGPVKMTVKTNNPGHGICQFSRQQPGVLRQLRISVDMMSSVPKQFPTYLAQCRSKTTPLQAIGNEAVMCAIERRKSEYTESVVGRVRDLAFTVGVSSSVENDPSMTAEMRREKANLVAEQVAGMLF